MKHLLSIALALLLMLAAACGDGSCYDNGNALPLARFYRDGKKITLSNVTTRGIGAPNDSAYVKGKSLSETYLPLRASTTSTQWIIEMAVTNDDTMSDTLTFHYTTVPYFASAECGAMFAFNIDKVETTRNLIDSVELVQRKVTNLITESIKIHFQ